MNVALLMQFLFNLLLAGLIAGIFLAFILLSRLFSYLSLQHPEIYQSLGKPHLFFNNTPRISWLTLRFIFGSQCELIGDDSLKQQTRHLRWLLGAFGVLFIVLIVSALGLAVFA